MENEAPAYIPVKFTTPARVLSLSQRADLDKNLPFDVDELMALAKKRAKNPARFDSIQPYFWLDQMSSDQIDSYWTRMQESTLRNFGQHATDGVSFQYSHDWKRLGLGYSLKGMFEAIAGRTPESIDPVAAFSQRALGYFFTVPGIKMNSEMSTDDFIIAVDTGVLQDVSVGFYAEKMTCSICGGDMFSGWFGGIYGRCDHYPGITYEDPLQGGDGKRYGGLMLCYAWVHNGRLSEVSQVYDGATPGAGHLKAEIFAKEGALDGRTTRMLEAHYRIKLPGGAIVQTMPGAPGQGRSLDMDEDKDKERKPTEGANPPANPEQRAPEPRVSIRMDDDEDEVEQADDLEATDGERVLLTELQARFGADGITLAPTVRATIIGLCERLLELKGEAKVGRQYAKELREDAKRSGVAALGDKWDETRHMSLLNSLSIEDVRTMKESWDQIAAAKFPDGRKSTDQNGEIARENEPEGERIVIVESGPRL